MTFIKSLASGIALLCVLFASSASMAHSDEYLDAQKAPNGGQLRMAGVYHFELVVANVSKVSKSNPVLVYVTDHAGKKVSSANASGAVTILSGKTKTVIKLNPAGDNRLKGVGNYASSPTMKVVASITLPGKQTEQARFTPFFISKIKSKAAHAKHVP
ncbi:MAG TPA: hypothetical protein PKY03_02285 [Moraxellaceae bacterium]|nr:hypothetical protein [Moraxellaceae bacterium]HQV40416.1 hypothetical protein [Moraxellaceae bacterium]HQX89207.1 hypothetical protein [Moraxellaceae bacterium]